jgi:hypothetical protein
MGKFALGNMDEIRGVIKFKKLIVDGVCQYDVFCNQIKQDGNLSKQLIGIVSNMNQVANLQRLPKEKFRDITLERDLVKEFEIKKGDLRVYVIKEDGTLLFWEGRRVHKPKTSTFLDQLKSNISNQKNK